MILKSWRWYCGVFENNWFSEKLDKKISSLETFFWDEPWSGGGYSRSNSTGLFSISKFKDAKIGDLKQLVHVGGHIA